MPHWPTATTRRSPAAPARDEETRGAPMVAAAAAEAPLRNVLRSIDLAIVASLLGRQGSSGCQAISRESRRDGSARSGEVNAVPPPKARSGASADAGRNPPAGRARVWAGGTRSEHHRGGDDEIHEIATDLEQRRSRAVPDEPAQEPADEAV